MKLIFALSAAMTMMCAQVQALDCTMGRATYKPRTATVAEEGWQVRFAVNPDYPDKNALAPLTATLHGPFESSPLVLHYTVSQGYGGEHLYDESENGFSSRVLFFDADLQMAPYPGERAPEFMVIPELGSAMYYDLERNPDRKTPSETMWQLSACRR